jgi:hypothetical protein
MADAAGLGPVGGDTVGVQVPSPALFSPGGTTPRTPRCRSSRVRWQKPPSYRTRPERRPSPGGLPPGTVFFRGAALRHGGLPPPIPPGPRTPRCRRRRARWQKAPSYRAPRRRRPSQGDSLPALVPRARSRHPVRPRDPYPYPVRHPRTPAFAPLSASRVLSPHTPCPSRAPCPSRPSHATCPSRAPRPRAPSIPAPRARPPGWWCSWCLGGWRVARWRRPARPAVTIMEDLHDHVN